MEKTITLALATGHKSFSASLSKLVENYAELLASQGLLKTAMEYLKLLGSDEHSHELAILRDRIAFSTEGWFKRIWFNVLFKLAIIGMEFTYTIFPLVYICCYPVISPIPEWNICDLCT